MNVYNQENCINLDETATHLGVNQQLCGVG